MKTWNDYKDYVKKIDPESKKNLEDMENTAEIISALIKRRSSLGISQRELAAMCGIPQSSVARIESFKTTPKLDTLLKLMHPLKLKFSVTMAK